MDIIRELVRIELDDPENMLKLFMNECHKKDFGEINILKEEVKAIDNLFKKVSEWEADLETDKKVKVVYRGGIQESTTVGESIKLLSYTSSSFSVRVANNFVQEHPKSKLMILYVLPDVVTVETNKMSNTMMDEAECLIDRNVYWTLLSVHEPSEEVYTDTRINEYSITKRTICQVVISKNPLTSSDLSAYTTELQPYLTQSNELLQKIRSVDAPDYFTKEYDNTVVIDHTIYPFELDKFTKEIKNYQGIGSYCINLYLRSSILRKLNYFKKIDNYFKQLPSSAKQKGVVGYGKKEMMGFSSWKDIDYLVLYEDMNDAFDELFNKSIIVNGTFYKNIKIFYMDEDVNVARVVHNGKKMLFVSKCTRGETVSGYELKVSIKDENKNEKEIAFTFGVEILYKDIPLPECKFPFTLPDHIQIKNTELEKITKNTQLERIIGKSTIEGNILFCSDVFKKYNREKEIIRKRHVKLTPFLHRVKKDTIIGVINRLKQMYPAKSPTKKRKSIPAIRSRTKKRQMSKNDSSQVVR